MKAKNNFTQKICYFLFICVFLSCAKEDELSKKSVMSQGDELEGTAPESKLDKYLKRELLDPYNIEVQYRLKDVETDLDSNVTPASEEKAIQMINLIKYLCLDAFKKHSNPNFLKKYFPKTIVIVGSGAYEGNGTVKLGTAEGGVKIVLYDINNIDPKKPNRLVKRYFNTIFHEFSHILHQTKGYSSDFQRISGSEYKADSWMNYWSASNPSYAKGFISDYSSLDKNEDFVEIISHYITLSQEKWDKKINPKGTNIEGVKLMNKKLSIVKEYMKKSWNIDLDDMRAEVQNRLSNLSSIDINNID